VHNRYNEFQVQVRLPTKPVRKVSSNSEYLENRWRGLDVTWEPVRGDLTTHPWTVTLTWGYSVGNETPLTELVYCVTVALTNLLTFNGNFSLEKTKSRREPNLAVGVLTDLGVALFCQKILQENCTRRVGRRIAADSLICSLGYCECDGHTVHKLSQQCLTAEWLAPQESDCSRTRRRAHLTGYQVTRTSRPCDRFSRYSKWLDIFRTGLVLSLLCVCKRTVSIKTSVLLWHSICHKGKNRKDWLVLTNLHMES